MTALLLDGAGWIGAVLVIIAYALISFHRLSATSVLYQGLNIVGSILLIINTAWHAAWPSAAVNVVWAAIGLAAVTRRSATP
ncbi:MAG TPA: hypothetical protein VNW46_04445 [Gemmatimonadaceae bacterium]|jgi:hypothetical protein|nr:hypothetical protein [Gemmatimonadaceae bacterium]